jgi:hypothetical protein
MAQLLSEMDGLQQRLGVVVSYFHSLVEGVASAC